MVINIMTQHIILWKLVLGPYNTTTSTKYQPATEGSSTRYLLLEVTGEQEGIIDCDLKPQTEEIGWSNESHPIRGFQNSPLLH